MRVVGTVITTIIILGVSLGSCRFLADRPARPVPVGPVPLAYATEEIPNSPVDPPVPTATATAGQALVSGVAATPPLSEAPDDEVLDFGAESLPDEPPADSAWDDEPQSAAAPASTQVSEHVPAALATGRYTSPGIGSPKAVALEKKTLDYLNWARARQGIQPYRMNPEMQALAREQALLYVQSRESTGQYPPAENINAATKARRWFFEDGGGPDPSLWLRWSYTEMESGYSLRYEPFYRNPKGNDIGIAFAFYSGKGAFGQAGGSVVVFVWNGEWDG